MLVSRLTIIIAACPPCTGIDASMKKEPMEEQTVRFVVNLDLTVRDVSSIIGVL